MNAYKSISSLRHLTSFLHETRYIILFYVFGDFLTTAYALQYGFEENGFLSAIMDRYGVMSLLILKLLFLGIVYYNYRSLLSSGSKLMENIWHASKTCIALVGIFLVLNNTLVICGSYSLIQMIRLL